jgi:hypothetical protein
MNERPDADERATLPPGKPDADVSAFEAKIRSKGESSARWRALMSLLSGEKETEEC